MLSKFAVSSPVKVTMIFVAVILLGWISLRRLPTNLFPDIRAPRVTTTIRTIGLSPLEVERRINQPLERQLSTLRGVTDVTTIARADSAVIVTDFTFDTQLDFAFLDVKKAVGDLQRARSTEIESASVLRFDPNAAPVMTVGMAPVAAIRGAGDEQPVELDLADLRRLAERTLKPRFERLEGVANVVLSGGEEQEVRILLDETLLLAYGVDVNTVVGALRQENVNATGGFVNEGARRYLLKAIGEFREIDEVSRVVVKREGDAPILLGDVARVEVGPTDARSIVYVNGVPGIGMAFYREAESNTVAVARLIREEIESIQGFPGDPRALPGVGGGGGPPGMRAANLLPEGVQLVIVNDQSQFIRSAIAEVRNNALLGGLLAIIVLFLFLRDVRTTLVIAVAIPVSIIATFNLMFFQGLSLNLMTLGGLALGTGMLVDNAIVVLENIFRLRQGGAEPAEAARVGGRQVAGAIIAATLTTVVVFLPIVYVQGVAALLFKEQALTVAYSLLASLVVALLLIPMLASRFLGKPPKTMLVREGESAQAPRNAYTWLLRWALRLRFVVLVLAAGSMWFAWQVLQGIPQEFLPRTEQRQVGLRLVMPNGTPIDATARVAQTVLDRADAFGPAMEIAYAQVGESTGEINADTEDPDGPNTADVFFTLMPADEPTTAMLAAGLGGLRSTRFIEEMAPKVESIPEVKAEFRLDQGSVFDLIGGSKAPLLIEIRGADLDMLTSLANEVAARLGQTGGILNVRTNILEGSPEVQVRLDRVQLQRLGFDVQGVADVLRRRLEGEVAGQIKREAGDLDLRVEVDYGRETLDTLAGIVLRAPTGATTPLGAVATFNVVRGPREIVRTNQERVARVMADLDEIKLSEGIARASASLDSLRLPTGYTMVFTGEERSRAEEFGRLGFALALSILLVYMVMASVFESFLQPFLIMVTIPLAGVGVVGAFVLTDQTLNIMALIGVVMLGGIVVNNAIVLLDCVNQMRSDAGPGADDHETLVAGCSRRLRPVLMTTLTTLLGLLPLALGFGDGAELRQAMAVAVLGGLVSSTVLTLLVIPVCQSYLDSARAMVRRAGERFGRGRRDVEGETSAAGQA